MNVAFCDLAPKSGQSAGGQFRSFCGAPNADTQVATVEPKSERSVNKHPRTLALSIGRFMFRRLANKRPTMLFRGAQSDIISPVIAEHMQRMAPRLQRVDVRKAGLAPTLAEPAAIDAVNRFLRTVA